VHRQTRTHAHIHIYREREREKEEREKERERKKERVCVREIVVGKEGVTPREGEYNMRGQKDSHLASARGAHESNSAQKF